MMRPLPFRPFECILVIKPSAVGDVVHALPVLVKLRARFPAARIDWLITPENADLVRHHPALSHVVSFPRRQYARFGRSWDATAGPLRLLAEIRRNRYDLVIDLHGQLRSAIFTLASGAPTRIGFDRPRRHVARAGLRRLPRHVWRHGWAGAREGAWVAYTHRIPIPTLDVHAVDRYLWLAPLLGLDDGPPDFRIHVPPEAIARAEGLLESQGLGGKDFALLVPGTIWPTKHWHVAGFAQVGRYFRESGLAVVLAGTLKDRARCQAIAASCPGACDLSGRTTLADLIALIRRATICITNDSGSMHLAVALDRPVVSIFGPTDPVHVGPYGRPLAVVRADVPCAPCYLRRLPSCPNGHRCMEDVTAAMVIERAEQILAGATS
ncbi:MAG: glycosyltransferase family 9 protein [Isosphaeraceae bacterium]|nr:glycosyltransferase family 9 protein [Isosphaeraceae bacterium]